MSDLHTVNHLPQPLVRLVRRCVAKDVDRRYPSAREVHNDLLDLSEDLEGKETTAFERSAIEWLADDTTTVITIHGGRRRLAMIVGGVVLVALISLAIALL